MAGIGWLWGVTIVVLLLASLGREPGMARLAASHHQACDEWEECVKERIQSEDLLGEVTKRPPVNLVREILSETGLLVPDDAQVWHAKVRKNPQANLWSMALDTGWSSSQVLEFYSRELSRSGMKVTHSADDRLVEFEGPNRMGTVVVYEAPSGSRLAISMMEIKPYKASLGTTKPETV